MHTMVNFFIYNFCSLEPNFRNKLSLNPEYISDEYTKKPSKLFQERLF